MTLEEFRKENPEAAAALLAEAQADANNAAIQQERQRIADIDAISGLFSDDVVNAAKYGENACTAQEMAYRAAVESAKLGKKFMSDVQKDYKDSGANDVGAAPSSEDEDKPMTNADKEAAGEAMANKLFGNNKEV